MPSPPPRPPSPIISSDKPLSLALLPPSPPPPPPPPPPLMYIPSLTTTVISGIPPPPPPPPPPPSGMGSPPPPPPPPPSSARGPIAPPPPPPPPSSFPGKKIQALNHKRPAKKLKPFFWTKVSADKVPSTIWNDVDDSVELDMKDLENTFSMDNNTNGGSQLSVASNKKQGPTTLLDGTRAQNVG